MRIQKKCGFTKKMTSWELVGKGRKAKVVKRTRKVKVCKVKKLARGKRPQKGWRAGEL